MLEVNQSITLSAISYYTDENGTKSPVVYMSATVSDNGGNPTISKSIHNIELYKTNKLTVDVDMKEFEDVALNLVK